MDTPTALDLCELAWGGKDGYVSLSIRNPSLQGEPGYWKDRTFKWPQDRAKVVALLDKATSSSRDVYWSPAVYDVPHRDKDRILPLDVLWADLDEVDPSSLAKDLKPTAAWQTSPGRYQALWKLESDVSSATHEALNRGLTYEIGADKGGWDLTQVLRIPGTHNHKYPDEPTVTFEWMNGHRMNALEFVRFASSNGDQPKTEASTLPDPDKVLKKYKINVRAHQLLRARSTNAAVGMRSERLWELECLLAEAGMNPEEIVSVVRRSAWNKFAGRNDELSRLFSEAGKALKKVEMTQESEASVTTWDNPEDDDEPTPLTWSAFDRDHRPIQWLVADVWGEAEVGFISGLPKSYKSWLALDLAVSVSTGTRFLGSFACRQQNVLLVQEEDPKAVMQDRLVRIGAAKGYIWAEVTGETLTMQYDLPDNLYIISNGGFTITNPENMEMLYEWIKRLDIGLVVLDPLMMMAEGIDEFKAFDMMANVFKPLKRLRAATQAAICVVHHHVKSDAGSIGGQRMYGSVATWAWEEAALHLQVAQPGKVIAERFSKHSNLSPLTIDIGDIEVLGWKPGVSEGVVKADGGADILDTISLYPSGVTIEELQKTTGAGRDAIQRQLKQLEESGRLTRFQAPMPVGHKGRRPSAWRIT